MTEPVTNPAFTPEPPPQNSGGIAVWPYLIRTLRDPGNEMYGQMCRTPAGRAVYEQWLKDMQERHEEGIRRYGVPLETNNGRDALVDGYQETLDGLVFLCQADLEGVLDEALGLLVGTVLEGDLFALRGKMTVDLRLLSFLLSAAVHARRAKLAETKAAEETP